MTRSSSSKKRKRDEEDEEEDDRQRKHYLRDDDRKHRDKDRGRDRDRDREKDREKDRGREREREDKKTHHRSSDREKGREREREKERKEKKYDDHHHHHRHHHHHDDVKTTTAEPQPEKRKRETKFDLLPPSLPTPPPPPSSSSSSSSLPLSSSIYPPTSLITPLPLPPHPYAHMLPPGGGMVGKILLPPPSSMIRPRPPLPHPLPPHTSPSTHLTTNPTSQPNISGGGGNNNNGAALMAGEMKIDIASMAASILAAKEELKKKLTSEILKSSSSSSSQPNNNNSNNNSSSIDGGDGSGGSGNQQFKTKEQIQEEALSRALSSASSKRKVFIPSIILDEQGRDISQPSTSLISPANNIKEFKINRKLDRKQLTIIEPEKLNTDTSSNKLYDPRLGIPKPNLRDKRSSFRFVRPGSYIKEAQTIRAEIWSNQRLAPSGNQSIEAYLFEALHTDDVPIVEWWDEPYFLPSSSSSQSMMIIGDDGDDDMMMSEDGGVDENDSHSANNNDDVKSSSEKGTTTLTSTSSSSSSSSSSSFSTGERGEGGEGGKECRLDEITAYIAHPTPEKPPAELPEPPPKAGYLTKKEQKKLKRMKRAEVAKEKQLKIMMGLEKEPPPRATLSNMIRVYGAEAFQDPTKVEQMVRQQMQERLEKHIRGNLERKLTPKEKKIKKLEKLRKMDTATISVAVFKVLDLSSHLNRKKIDLNVRDLGLSGVLIICPVDIKCNLVVVEGAPRAVKKFKKLMINRIKWFEHHHHHHHHLLQPQSINNDSNSSMNIEINDHHPSSSSSSETMDIISGGSREGKGCYLVWEGEVMKRQFKRFRFHDVTSTSDAKLYLEKRNAVHYWDLAYHYSEKLMD